MKNLIKKTYSENKNLFKNKHKKILLAVSGGIDSMVLLEYFITLKDKFFIDEVAVAHINHGIRAQSEEEESYLREYCKEKDIPIYVKKFTGTFSENSAREFRYKFFCELMNQYNYTALVTAHHNDDQAETVLMRIIRGVRLLDLKGIQKVQKFNNGELIRPFLNINKKDLPNVFHFVDHTNFENDYTRNRVRNIYIPELSKENPAFSKHLVSLSNEAKALDSLLDDFISKVNYNDLKVFRSYKNETQFYFIQKYLEIFPGLALSKGTVKDLLNMLNNHKTYNKNIKNDYFINISKTEWCIYKK